jgi:hypothetical protein
MAVQQSTGVDAAAGDDVQVLEERDARALTECMTVLPDIGRARDVPGVVVVVGEGSQYLVDVDGESCECPDARHRDVRCKHLRRCEFALGRRPVPAWVDDDRVDDQLGVHVQ